MNTEQNNDNLYDLLAVTEDELRGCEDSLDRDSEQGYIESMNQFILDTCPEQAARWYCDKHCVKMPLEIAQQACTAFWSQGIEAPYQKTHFNHPSSVFTRASCLNFEWTLEHAKALCDEYTARYGRRHASQDVIEWCDKHSGDLSFDQFEQTDFAIAIAPEMKCRQVAGFDKLSAVDKYRLYYIFDKKHLHSWKRNKPKWIEEKNLTDQTA